MNDPPGTCSNAYYAFSDDFTIDVTKYFSKVEGDGHDEGGEGKKGNCHGSGGKPDTAGHSQSEEPHEHESDFEKLAPIHMFITLKNTSENYDTEEYDEYTFNEKIFNEIDGISWDGFFFALKQNEDSRALFQNDRALWSNTFSDLEFKGKKQTWSGGLFEPGDDPLLFSFNVRFFDVAEDFVKEDGTFTVMLQEFPLVMVPAPEPTTLLLFGTGLAGLAGISRRRKK